MSARDPARAVKVSICCGLFGEARIGRSGISGTRRRLIGALRYVRGKHQITGTHRASRCRDYQMA